MKKSRKSSTLPQIDNSNNLNRAEIKVDIEADIEMYNKNNIKNFENTAIGKNWKKNNFLHNIPSNRKIPSEIIRRKKANKKCFTSFEGIPQNDDIEKTLINNEFIPIEKILTKDINGNIACRFIKARDKMGRTVYIELDCDYTCGLGFISVSEDDRFVTETNTNSIVPYSVKIGTFEANNENIDGIVFECRDNFCVISKKDNDLTPIETVYIEKDNDDVLSSPIPFPIVKMTEILANSKAVVKNIALANKRLRHGIFATCVKDIENMKKTAEDLKTEIEEFNTISNNVTSLLSQTIDQLENMYENYENKKTPKSEKDLQNMKSISFNLNKRFDLLNDQADLCMGMKERCKKIAILREEIKSINEFSKQLFTGLSGVFTEQNTF